MKKENITLSNQIMKLSRLMMYRQMMSFRQGGYRKHGGRTRLLCAIKMEPGITEEKVVQMLSRRADEPRELLEKLIKKGYLVREGDGCIALGEKGLEETAAFNAMDDMFSCLSSEEQDNMKEYCARVMEHLEESMDNDDDDEDWDMMGRFQGSPWNMEGGFGFQGRGCHGHMGGFARCGGDFHRGF